MVTMSLEVRPPAGSAFLMLYHVPGAAARKTAALPRRSTIAWRLLLASTGTTDGTPRAEHSTDLKHRRGAMPSIELDHTAWSVRYRRGSRSRSYVSPWPDAPPRLEPAAEGGSRRTSAAPA